MKFTRPFLLVLGYGVSFLNQPTTALEIQSRRSLQKPFTDSIGYIQLPSNKTVYTEKYHRDSAAEIEDIPIIFIHGFLNTVRTWTSIIRYFPERTRILYDMEGHGNTPAGPAPITIESLATDTHDILTYYGYSRAIVVGHSAGAVVALEFAHLFANQTERLILMGPLGLPLPLADMMNNANIIRSAPMEDLLAVTLRWLGKRASQDSRLVGLVTSETERHEYKREGVARNMEGIAQYVFAGIGEVKPWIIRGLGDGISTEGAAGSVKQLTNGTIVVLDTGHYFTWEDPVATVDALSIAIKG